MTLNIGYLKTVIASAVALTAAHYEIATIVACVVGLGLIAYPIWSGWFLLRRQNSLEQQKVKEKYDNIYSGLNLKSRPALMFNSVFLLRRLTMGLLILSFNGFSYL